MKVLFILFFSILFNQNIHADVPFPKCKNEISKSSVCFSASIEGIKVCVTRFNIYLDNPNDIDDVMISIMDAEGNIIDLDVYSEGEDDTQFIVITFPENGVYTVTFSLAGCEDVTINVEILGCDDLSDPEIDCFEVALFKEKGCVGWFYLSFLSNTGFKFDVTMIDTETDEEIQDLYWEVDDIFTNPLLQLNFPYNGTFEITLSSPGCEDYIFEYTATTCQCEVTLQQCVSKSLCFYCFEYEFDYDEVSCIDWTATDLTTGDSYNESDAETIILSGNLFEFGNSVEVCVHVCAEDGCEATSCTTLIWCNASFLHDNADKRAVNQTLSVIYPNPVNDDLLIIEMADLNEIFRLKIFDIHGNLIAGAQVEDGKMDVSGLPKGLYIVVVDNGMFLETHRLIRL